MINTPKEIKFAINNLIIGISTITGPSRLGITSEGKLPVNVEIKIKIAIESSDEQSFDLVESTGSNSGFADTMKLINLVEL